MLNRITKAGYQKIFFMIESNHKTSEIKFRDEWIDFIHGLQNKICAALEATDGKAKFIEDKVFSIKS